METSGKCPLSSFPWACIKPCSKNGLVLWCFICFHYIGTGFGLKEVNKPANGHSCLGCVLSLCK